MEMLDFATHCLQYMIANTRIHGDREDVIASNLRRNSLSNRKDLHHSAKTLEPILRQSCNE